MKMIRCLCNLLIVVIAVLSIALAAPVAFGMKLIVIETGSMSPALKAGSLCYVSEDENISEGDIITFYLNHDIVVTHRVAAVEREGVYTTKGDQNNTVDAKKVSKNQVIGKVRFHVPCLGYLAEWISTAFGKALTIVALIMGVVISHILS